MPGTQQISFSILTRVHRRPNSLKVCLDSLLAQGWSALTVLAIQDDPSDVRGREILDQFRSTLSIQDIQVQGLGFPACNLYFNQAAPAAPKNSWLLYLDDDNYIPSSSGLSSLADVIGKNNPSALFLKYAFPFRGERIVIPSEIYWGKMPVNNEFDSACICLPQALAVQHQWGSGFYGDVEFIQSIYQSIPESSMLWVDQVLIESQFGPQGGRGEY